GQPVDHGRCDEEGEKHHPDQRPAAPVELALVGPGRDFFVFASRTVRKPLARFVTHRPTRSSARPPFMANPTGGPTKSDAGCFIRDDQWDPMSDPDDHSHDHGNTPDHVHHDFGPVSFGVVTVSTSRTLDDDPAGDAITAAIEDSGDEVGTRELVDDDYDGVQGRVNTLVNRDDVDCIVTTGG